MVFQVIIVGVGVNQIHIPFFRQQQLLGAIFIDHVSRVVRCDGWTIQNMYRAEFSTIRCVQVGDGIAITERNYLWQR